MTTIENLLRNLSRLGPRKVILTGISFETEKIGLAYFDKETNQVIYRMRKRYQSHFYGDVYKRQPMFWVGMFWLPSLFTKIIEDLKLFIVKWTK